MSVIVMHAGMPKAGSSSIQRWLRKNAPSLREQGFTVVFAPPDESGQVVFRPYQRGPINSGWVVGRAVGRPAAEQQVAIDALNDGLSLAAETYGGIIVSSESFAHPIWALHGPALAGLQQLSTLHELRVAYYVRPQHTTLEAAWRQWGYRSEESPSAYVERYASHLHYAKTRKGVDELAPGLRLEPRPLRSDLLDSGDLVRDFAVRFLGIDVQPTGEWANRGLPLEVVNVLRAAPAGMFWDPSYGNERTDQIKQLLAGNGMPEDDRIALSRLVLRKYAFERFAAENAELGLDDFVPPPARAEEIPGIEALDSLWAPSASPAELALIFRALSAAI